MPWMQFMCGLLIGDMVVSLWVTRRSRRFTEATIENTRAWRADMKKLETLMARLEQLDTMRKKAEEH
jgi:CHASE3 domain sensor protein